ncbi:hypothetical protein [Arthrospiribacter ruber]|uniref:Uncharacterized protein n=1 Tax=Arthrospiribacter ruber TaxID=2487934 RepID=A0A951IS17_9BACT|nr:hypothetical protein [Arthrospiribacter ruber]MBW3466835.1 hypothetical protein [Arthrospiribacter ruber]
MTKVIILIGSFILVLGPILEGKWILEKFETFENIIWSKSFQELSNEDQIRGFQMYNLYMENVFLEFKSDTLHFKDLKNEKIIDKIGLWYIDKDTLIINDLEVLATYKYFIESHSDCELYLKTIFPDGEIAKNGRVFVNESCK